MKHFFTIIAVIFFILLTLSTNQYSFGQAFEESGPTTEAVTSINDAILKSGLIIFQVIALGMCFNHFVFKWYVNKKINKSFYSSRSFNSFFNESLATKRFAIVMVFSCIAIVILSSCIILLQSIELGSNLDLEILTAFSILYSTPVGDVWLLRIITSILTFGIILYYYYFSFEKSKYDHIFWKRKDKVKKENTAHPDKERITRILNQSILISAVVTISINLFSNSMVSHSNSLTDFSTLAVSMDWLHLMAVSVWVGGLFYMSFIAIKIYNLHHKKHGNGLLDNSYNNSTKSDKVSEYVSPDWRSIANFSIIAIVSLSILAVTGLYLSVVHIQTLGGLFFTTYGQLLLLKIGLAIPLVLIGRYNQNQIHDKMIMISEINPSSRKDNIVDGKNQYERSSNSRDDHISSKTRYFKFYKSIKNTLAIEIIVGVMVLIVAAFLSVTSPPSLETESIGTNLAGIGNEEFNISLLGEGYIFIDIVIILSILIIIVGILNYRRIRKRIK